MTETQSQDEFYDLLQDNDILQTIDDLTKDEESFELGHEFINFSGRIYIQERARQFVFVGYYFDKKLAIIEMRTKAVVSQEKN